MTNQITNGSEPSASPVHPAIAQNPGNFEKPSAIEKSDFVNERAAAKQTTTTQDVKKKVGWLAAGGVLVAKVFGPLAKVALPALKVIKSVKLFAVLGKVLTTSSTMLLSIWYYAAHWGLPFAVGFVVSIFAHELGHVAAAWRLGIPVSAPIFIPGMGALILQKQRAKSVWEEALIGIGGPLAGTLFGVLLFGAGVMLQSQLLLALAYTTFFINLFNLMPMMPLDGGWIVAAISTWLWLLGLAGLAYLFVSGWLHNPLIIFLVVVSLPGVFRGLRKRKAGIDGQADVTTRQRILMGSAYLLLCGFLFAMMLVSHIAL